MTMRAAALACLGLFFFAAPGLAQVRTPPPALAPVIEACGVDLKTHCAATPFAYGPAARCLRENRDKLAPSCGGLVDKWQAAFASSRDRLRPVRDAVRRSCEADWTSHCGSAARGAARSRCLRENEPKFAEGCRTALGDLRKLRAELRSARAE